MKASRKSDCRLRAMSVMVMMLVGALLFGVSAQSTGIPEISMFYPGERVPPMDVKPNAQIYVYFMAGAKIKEAKALVTQSGAEIGEITYAGAVNPGTTATMDPAKECNACMASLNPGEFTVTVFEVTYLESGVEKVYSDKSAPLGSIVYNRPEEAGKVVSQTGLENNTVLSYYPADAADGVKTYTCSKPLKAGEQTAYLEYGYGDVKFLSDVPLTLSADCLTLTADLRGVCRNVELLTDNYTFVDVGGAVLDPPTTITLYVRGLVCQDGSNIDFTATNGVQSVVIHGYILQNFDYKDITFPNPTITGVDFYNAGSPLKFFEQITPDTDMMAISVNNLKYLTSADVVIKAGETVATVDFADVTVGTNRLVMAIPAAIRAAGSKSLEISLVNAVFAEDDGAPHVIAPYRINTVDVITSLARLLQVDPDTKVVIEVPEGLKVTMSNDMGYTFIEDATAGVQVITPDYSRVLDEGTLVTGKIAGTYVGAGVFSIDADESDYTAAETDVETGIAISSLAELMSGDYDFRLVTLDDEHFSFESDIEEGMIMVEDIVAVIGDLVEDFVVPAEVKNVTGVLYKDPDMGRYMVLVRKNADINRQLTPSGISDVMAPTAVSSDVYDLRGIRVRCAGDNTALPTGIYVVGGRKVIVK